MTRFRPEAVALARCPKDNLVLVVCLGIIAALLAVMVGGGLLVAILAANSSSPVVDYWVSIGSYTVALATLLVISLVVIRIMRQTYLGNALQIEYSNYAWLRDWANTVAKQLDMPPVEFFITQDPVINAFAFGFRRPYTVVLQSGAIRYLSHDELKVVVVHEMAHVKYAHTIVGAYTNILRSVPLAGSLFGWILDFWSRRIELTADRLALCFLKDPELVKRSLIKVYVGPDVAEGFNDIARQWQIYNTNSSFNDFSQTFSNHPFLVRRLQQIDSHAYLVQPSSSAGSKPKEESSHAAAA